MKRVSDKENPYPDFAHTDEHEVVLTLDGQIQDENFLRFLEKIGQERLASFNTEDFLVLDLVHRESSIPSSPPELKIRLNHLIDLGIVERIGKGRAPIYALSAVLYSCRQKWNVYKKARS